MAPTKQHTRKINSKGTPKGNSKKSAPIPRKQYEEGQMLTAINAVKNGMPVATAARSFGVPRITLMYKASGKSPIQGNPGPNTVLTKEEEGHLVLWINKMARRGFPITSCQLQDSVQKLIQNLKRESPFVDDRPGRKWLDGFKRRNPSISHRVAENLTLSRASVTRAQIESWFKGTENYLKEHDFFDVLKDPRRIFNGDETAFFLNPKGKKVLAPKGDKSVYLTVNNDEKECLTVLITTNACAELAPPMVVFRYDRLPENIVHSMPNDWGIGKSQNGWMTGATFFEYFTNVFDPWLERSEITRPIIFFVDGHVSHLTYHLSEFCETREIILVALPPNTTHFMQPMDVAVFRSLKENWKTKVHDWRVKRVNEQNLLLKKKDFSPLLNEVLSHTLTYSMVANGFRKCGLYPWDYNVISLFAEDTSNSSSSCTNNEFDSKQILQGLTVMEHFMGEENVKKFKSSPSGTGSIEDESLFRVWKKMRRFFEDPVSQESLTPSQEVEDRGVELQNVDEIDVDVPVTICTPQELTSTSRSEQHQSIHAPNILLPSPFKKALIWPEERDKTAINKRKKEVLPSVVSSSDYKNYLKRKMDKKIEEEENKKARATQRARKKAEKELVKSQKVAEREMKKKQPKKQIQPKKKKTRTKKARLVHDSSSEEDEWQPDDNDVDEISDDGGNSNAFGQLDVGDGMAQCNSSTSVSMEANVSEFDEFCDGIVQSIQEVLDEPVGEEMQEPDLYLPTHQELDLRGVEGQFLGGKDTKEESMGQEPAPGQQDVGMESSAKEDQDYSKIQEDDYATVILNNKKKKTVVACRIYKIEGQQAKAYCLRLCNRMKTLFKVDTSKEILVEEGEVITKLPKPLICGTNENERLLFPEPINNID